MKLDELRATILLTKLEQMNYEVIDWKKEKKKKKREINIDIIKSENLK